VDPTKTPKELDAKHLTGASKGKTLKGIYRLQGDELQLCFGPPGDDLRPKTFTTKEGEPVRLYTLKRAKP
jgi:uncharacterized protein (TIGR03067 family)